MNLAELNVEESHEPPGMVRSFTLGQNHEAMNDRDRILYSACFKGDTKLFRCRVVLLFLSLAGLFIGIFFAFINERVDTEIKIALFFCTPDFYAWCLVVSYFLLALVATRRVRNFEKSLDPDALQVEIFQSQGNFFQQKLTTIEILTMMFFALSFIVQTVSFAYSVALYSSNSLVESRLILNFTAADVLFEIDGNNLRNLVVNSLMIVVILTNFILSRQIFTYFHLALSIVIGIVFIGGNGACTRELDVVVYDDLEWINPKFPETLYESIVGVSLFPSAWLLGKIIQFFREKYFFAFY